MKEGQEMEWLLKEKYHGEKSEAFFADCRKLALGEPLAYLIGHAPFLHTTIYLDSRPLIPRTETEYWVTDAIETIQQSQTPSLDPAHTKPIEVLDLCAGSGCIGIAVAHALANVHVDFSEIEEKHIATIQRNLKQNDIADYRATIFHTNLFQGIAKKYDFILSNPPYIDSDLNRVDESVRDFEPHLALFGGKGGIEVIETIIQTSSEHLMLGGQLWLEHEPEQSQTIAVLADDNGFSCTTHPDQYGRDRYSVLVLQ